MTNNWTGNRGGTYGQKKEIGGDDRDTEETPTRQGVSWNTEQKEGKKLHSKT